MYLEDNPQLAAMVEILGRIEALLATKAKKRRKFVPPSRWNEAAETTYDQTPIIRLPQLWAELCPHCPQPLPMTIDRKATARAYWEACGGEENVRALFSTVAADDWLSGRLVGRKGSPYSRPRGAVGLFEAIKNASAILEGEYK
jgi:hypothetical protein